MYEGEFGQLMGVELTRQVVENQKNGAVVRLDLHSIESFDSPIKVDCSGAEARCRSVQWAYDCDVDVDVSALDTLEGLREYCFDGNFFIDVDPGEDQDDGLLLTRGVWELEGFFAVDDDLCMQGHCGAFVRRIPPEVARQTG